MTSDIKGLLSPFLRTSVHSSAKSSSSSIYTKFSITSVIYASILFVDLGWAFPGDENQGTQCLSESSRQNFTSNYGALFAKSLGTINPFSVTVMLGAVDTATAFLAMVLTDKLGRRRVFLVISRSHDSNYLV